ncbi:Uncharacterised protein [uncultured archaeon]|nr:Uncharacterised protein [uncultured archaeon]
MNMLVEKGCILHFEGKRLEPVSRQRNAVGLCSGCDNDLESLAYYSVPSGWLVYACCKNNHLALMHYDIDWNWLGDLDIEVGEDRESISSIPREKLDVVFTPAEVRDMHAYQQGQPYTRQNLYRARAKFEKFEKLFGIKINL